MYASGFFCKDKRLGPQVVLIASGPSVTEDQIQTAREWRLSGDNRYVMVVNRSHLVAPWADFLWTMDGKFLRLYGDEIKESFMGRVFTHKIASHIPAWVEVVDATSTGNSGSTAIEVLVRWGANTIYLIGCDAKWDKSGKRHHHQDYEKNDSPGNTCFNCPNVHEFKRLFEKACKMANGTKIINCSPDSALGFLPNLPLKEALGMVRSEEVVNA